MATNDDQAQAILDYLQRLEDKTNGLGDKGIKVRLLKLEMRVQRIENYIIKLDDLITSIGKEIKKFSDTFGQYMSLFLKILQPLSFVFEFVAKFTGAK